MANETQSEVIDSITQQAMDALRADEDDTADALLQAFEDAKANILARVQQAFPGETWDMVSMSQGRTAQLIQEINAEIARLNGVLVTTTKTAVVDQFQDSAEWSAYMVDQATPPNVSVNLNLPPVSSLQAILSTPFQGAMFSQRYTAMTDAMASDIRDQLVQSMIGGESMDDAAGRVADVMGDANSASTFDALRIARTEIMRASNLGAYNTFQNQNAQLMAGTPNWYTTADDKLCPWCLGRDGHTEEEIKALHLTARGKSDPWRGSATMPLHPFCRCRWTPNLKSWKQLGIDIPEDAADDARSLRMPDGKWQTAPVETFQAWQSKRAQTFGLGAQS